MCAAVNQVTTYAAFIIGCIGGLVYMIVAWIILYKMKVDDPLDATAGTQFNVKNKICRYGCKTFQIVRTSFPYKYKYNLYKSGHQLNNVLDDSCG